MNIDNPSFRAFIALLGETLVGASALLVAGFVCLKAAIDLSNKEKIV